MNTFLKTALLSAACALTFTASAHAADSFTPAQKEELGGIIKQYMLDHPEHLIEALNSYQKKQEEERVGKFKENLESKRSELMDGGSPFAGNPKGDVVVVEFFDYNCGYCKKAFPDVAKLIEEDKNVKVVFKEYPILSPTSHDAAAWAIAANKQGKYWEFHSALMKQQGQLSEATLESVAKEAGLDVEKTKKLAKEDEGIKKLLENDIALAGDLGIRGTPAFIIGDSLNPGYMGYEALKKAVSDARAAKKK